MIQGKSIWALDIDDLRLLSRQIEEGQFDPEVVNGDIEPAVLFGEDTSLNKIGPNESVAQINIDGRITPKTTIMTLLFGGTSVESIRKQLKAAEDDETVDKVLMRIDSPGGKATAVPGLAQQIRDMETETVTFADNMMSAAYWIGSAADRVVAGPTSMVGSIGVYALVTSYADKLEDEGIDTKLVRSVEGKAKTHPTEQISEEGVEQVQSIVDKSHDAFVEAVANNRNLSKEFVNNNMADGDVRVGEEAEEANFTDETLTVEDIFAEFEVDEDSDLDRQEQENEFLRSKVAELAEDLSAAQDQIGVMAEKVENMVEENQKSEIEDMVDRAIEEDHKFEPSRREELEQLASENFEATKNMIDMTPEGAAAPSDPVDTDGGDSVESDQAVEALEAQGLIPVHTEEEAEVYSKLGTEYNKHTGEGDWFKAYEAEKYLET